MDAWAWLWTLVGAALVILVLVDVFLTVLHPNADGPLTHSIQKAVASGLVAVTRRLPKARRTLIALAGPLMLVVTIMVWPVLVILGFAFIQWPHVSAAYRSEPELVPLGFVDALYYSGITATVLGYGDITPITPILKVLAIVEAGLGFVVLTGIVTYLVNILSTVAYRNVAALRVSDDTGSTGRGVDLVTSHLPEGVDVLRRRFEEWAEVIRNLQEKYAMYPLATFYYRPRTTLQDPEPLLRSIGEAAIAGLVITRADEMRALRPVVQRMEIATKRYVHVLAKQHLGRDTVRRIDDPEPTDEDQAFVDAIRRKLEAQLGTPLDAAGEDEERRAVRLASRLRVILEDLDAMTAWRMDHERHEPGA